MDTRRLTLLRHGQAEPADGFPEDFPGGGHPLARSGSSESSAAKASTEVKGANDKSKPKKDGE